VAIIIAKMAVCMCLFMTNKMQCHILDFLIINFSA